MNKKIIILLLFLAIIMSGCIQKPVKPNNEQPENNNVVQKNDEENKNKEEIYFDINKIKEGDKVGNLMVKSIEPYNKSFSNLTDKNFKVVFEGEIEVKGKINKNKSECFSPSEESGKILPKTKDYPATFFCFKNFEEISSEFINKDKDVEKTIIIKNYTFNYYPSEVFNEAIFVELKK